jgi:hypothetical protein
MTISRRIMSAEARWQLLEHVGPEALLQLGDAPKHGGVVQPEAPDDGPHARRQESSERHPSRSSSGLPKLRTETRPHGFNLICGHVIQWTLLQRTEIDVSAVLYARVSTSGRQSDIRRARLAPRDSRSTRSLPTTVCRASPRASSSGRKGAGYSICCELATSLWFDGSIVSGATTATSATPSGSSCAEVSSSGRSSTT